MLSLALALVVTQWPPVITAERLVPGPAPKALAGGTTGHATLTRDGEWLVFLTGDGVQVTSLKTLQTRSLQQPAGWLLLSTDSKYVVVPDAPFTRLSLSGKDGKVRLAPTSPLHALAGQVIGKNHLVFTGADGVLVDTTLDEGTARRLEGIAAPRTGQCHAGRGYPRALSDDDQWLLFQHGCEEHGVIRLDGTGLVYVPATRARLLAGHLVSSAETGPLRVTPLDGSAGWELDGQVLGVWSQPVPGKPLHLLQLTGDRLELVDLKTKKVAVVYAGADAVNPFFEVTPDGKRALLSTTRKAGCEVFSVELTSLKRQRLARLDGAVQCFVKPAGNATAGIYAWTTETGAVLLEVDLASGAVKQLGTTLEGIGNFHASPRALVVESNTTHALWVAPLGAK